MQTLDVYQVQGIVKQAQAEFRQKFEQDHPLVVEFLTNEITLGAKNLLERKIIDVTSILKEVEYLNIEKYLNLKGFYTKRACKHKKSDDWFIDQTYNYKDDRKEEYDSGFSVEIPKG